MFDLTAGRGWLPVPLTAAGLIALAACGGGDGAAPATELSTTTASADAFAECMEEQGVPAPQGGRRLTGPGKVEPGGQGAPVTRVDKPPAPDGVDPEKWDAALEACRPEAVRRTVAPGGGSS
jgi:hypothetical protein